MDIRTGPAMEDSTGRAFRFVVGLIVLAALAVFLSSIRELVRLVVIAILLSYIIDPIAVMLESRGLSRTKATVIIFSSIMLAVILIILLVLPAVVRELSSIQEAVRSGQVNALLARLELLIGEKTAFLGASNLQLAGRLNDALMIMKNWMIEHALDMVTLITGLIIMPVFIFFFLKDGREIIKQIVGYIPNRYFEFSLSLIHKMDMQLGNYLRGQFLDALIFGVLSIVALWVLGVRFFLLIGIIAGMANLIPFLGPVAGATIAVLISVLDTGTFASTGSIIMAFALIKLLDDAVIQPVVVARSVAMHPLAVLLAIIIGGHFFGVLGMILSVPVAGFMKVVFRESLLNYRRFRLSAF